MAIRLWGLSFGLPEFFSGDEVNKRDGALHLAERNYTHVQGHPSFVYNSLYIIFSLARLLNPEWTLVDYHYLGRFWMAMLGALTVVVLYRLGSLWDSRIGFLAALFLAILPLHTACSRYMKEDAPLALMTTITIMLVILYLRRPSRSTLSMAALFAGISFSTKYSGLVLVFPLMLALAVSAWRSQRETLAILVDLVLTALAFWTGFFMVSPIFLLHPDMLLSGFLFQSRYSMAGHDGILRNPWSDLWLYYVRTGLIPGMTWPVFLLSVAGLVSLPRLREGWVVTLTAVWLYLVFEHSRAKPDPFSARYLLPLAPLLCLSAADALARGAAFLKQRLPAPAVYGLCATLFVLPPLGKTLLIADEALHDTRFIAGAWMEQVIPPGSKIVVTSKGVENLPVSRYWRRRWQVFYTDGSRELAAAWRDGPPPYFVLTSFKDQRFLDNPEAVPHRTRLYRQVMSEYRLVKEFRPRWLTYGKHSPVIRIYQPPIGAQRPS